MADQIDSVMYNVKSSKTTKGVDPGDINTFVLPGMQTVTIANGIQRIERLNRDMHESKDLCEHISTRLRFLQTVLPRARASIDPDEYTKIVRRYAFVVVSAIDFIKHYSSKRGLQRVVASRAVREGVRRVCSEIDAVFSAAGFRSAPEMTERKKEDEEAIHAQHARLTELVSNPATLVNGLTNEELREALAEIQLELARRPNPQRFQAVLDLARTAVAEPLGIDLADYSIPEWFVSRDDVTIGEWIGEADSGDLHRATWSEERVKVCAYVLFAEGSNAMRSAFAEYVTEDRVKLISKAYPEIQQGFVSAIDTWSKLVHPHILQILGACHVGTPLFFISELARSGNLVDYLENTPKDKQKIWQYFLDAAQGLSYLHENEIVHGNLKCNNILIANDGNAQLCDFGFSHARTLAINETVKGQSKAVRWKAPECLLEVGVAANPTFASDVYSLGMCIIEAMTGHVPWGVVGDDDIIDEVVSGDGYPRPAVDVFTDNEWNLVLGMTAFDVTKRKSLAQVIETMRELAEEEALMYGFEKQPAHLTTECPNCGNSNPANSNFCNECGCRLFDHSAYLRSVEQVDKWRADEPMQRREWDASVPQFSWCEACYCDNPLDNTFCCECDEVLSMYMSREDCAFRFVVMDVPALEVVLDTFRLKIVLLAKQSRWCPACGSLNPRDWSKCSNCDYTEPLTRAALLSEIDRLTIVLEHSKAVADTRKRQHELEDQLPEYPCSRCGEMNPEDEAYCRECGLDIEVIDDLDWIPEEHPIPV